MDINELLHREQVSLANAVNAACAPSRRAHEGLARGYGVRLTAAGFPHRPYRSRMPGKLPCSISDLVTAIL
jgi:hypothetical protein